MSYKLIQQLKQGEKSVSLSPTAVKVTTPAAKHGYSI